MAHDQARPTLTGVETTRGVAACLVVLYHLARHMAQDTGALPFGALTTAGHAGVDVFFVLSGFIILHVHWDDIGRPDRLWRYVVRRATRIYPVYWAVLAATLALLLMRHKPWPAPAELLRDLLLLPYGEPTLGVAWTLQYEIAFYALFSVLILSRRLGLALLGGWGGAILLAQLAPAPMVPALPALLASPYGAQFFMGMAAAAWLRRAGLPRPRLVLAAGLLGLLLAGACETLDLLDGRAAPARLAYGLPATLALLGLVAAERAGQLRPPAAGTMLGRGSYAIYLTHLLVIGIAWKLLGALAPVAGQPSPEAAFLTIGAASILGGLLFSRLVEQPMMRAARARLA